MMIQKKLVLQITPLLNRRGGGGFRGIYMVLPQREMKAGI